MQGPSHARSTRPIPAHRISPPRLPWFASATAACARMSPTCQRATLKKTHSCPGWKACCRNRPPRAALRCIRGGELAGFLLGLEIPDFMGQPRHLQPRMGQRCSAGRELAYLRSALHPLVGVLGRPRMRNPPGQPARQRLGCGRCLAVAGFRHGSRRWLRDLSPLPLTRAG